MFRKLFENWLIDLYLSLIKQTTRKIDLKISFFGKMFTLPENHSKNGQFSNSVTFSDFPYITHRFLRQLVPKLPAIKFSKTRPFLWLYIAAACKFYFCFT